MEEKDVIGTEPVSVADAEKAADAEEVADTNTDGGDTPEDEKEAIDYRALAESDFAQLQELFPELRAKKSIAELSNPLRYAALRDLGLSPKEAYLATEEPHRRYDNRSHLKSAVPGSAGASEIYLSGGELEAARELFSGLSDREIQKLYKKVIK